MLLNNEFLRCRIQLKQVNERGLMKYNKLERRNIINKLLASLFNGIINLYYYVGGKLYESQRKEFI